MKRPIGFRAQVRAYIGFLEQKKLARMKALARYPRRGGILFLGDSLTEEFPFADLLPGFDIVGRGYSGDTAGMLQERLSYTCAPYAPRAAFLQVGINDLQRGSSPEETAAAAAEALDAVRALCPAAKLHLLALYPVNVSAERFALFRPRALQKPEALKKIARCNALLSAAAGAREIDFLDLGARLKDERGELKEAYSCDGLHLTVDGYAALAEGLRPSLVRCGQTEEFMEVRS